MRSEGENDLDIWGKNDPGRQNSKYKVSKVEYGCPIKRNSQNEASVWNGVSESNEQKARDTVDDGWKVSL